MLFNKILNNLKLNYIKKIAQLIKFNTNKIKITYIELQLLSIFLLLFVFRVTTDDNTSRSPSY